MSFCEGKAGRLLLFLMLEAALLAFSKGQARASSEVQQAEAEQGGSAAPADLLGELLDLGALERGFQEASGTSDFSFSGALRRLICGELPFDVKQLPALLAKLFFTEVREQRQMALQILIVVLACAVCSNFIRVFDSSQIADISFYMMYLLISGMLIRSFLAMSQMVVNACGSVQAFMKILLPSYVTTVVLCSGSVTALGFYEITLLGINLTQSLVLRLVLPAINFYLILLILNQMSEEDYFSKLAGLLETVIGWVLKSVTGLVVGLQAVQCLIAPSVDTLKHTAAQRLAKAIPGIGGLLDSAAETVAASALVIKNAVGIAGIIAVAVICLTPILKLAACILMFRFLCAAIQPISEKRMVDGIESISRGAVLLLKILMMSASVFVISLAMVTSSARCG